MRNPLSEWTTDQLRDLVLSPANLAGKCDYLAELLRRERAAAIKQAVALLLAMAEDAERFAASSMARLDDLAKAGAFREAARRVAELK